MDKCKNCDKYLSAPGLYCSRQCYDVCEIRSRISDLEKEVKRLKDLIPPQKPPIVIGTSLM